jgi:hypothetical protein
MENIHKLIRDIQPTFICIKYYPLDDAIKKTKMCISLEKATENVIIEYLHKNKIPEKKIKYVEYGIKNTFVRILDKDTDKKDLYSGTNIMYFTRRQYMLELDTYGFIILEAYNVTTDENVLPSIIEYPHNISVTMSSFVVADNIKINIIKYGDNDIIDEINFSTTIINVDDKTITTTINKFIENILVLDNKMHFIT